MATTLTAYEADRDGTAITKNDCTTVIEYQVALTGLEFIVVENGSGTEKTVTLLENGTYVSNTGYQDNEGGAVAAGATKVYGPFTNISRWKDGSGYLQFTLSATDAALKVYVVRNPTTSTQADTEA